jgi:hypothetical protein
MESIKIRKLIGQDGILHLQIPVGIQDKEIEVMVIYQPIEVVTPINKIPEELGWSPGFLEQTAGCLADDPIQRYPQGKFEERQPIE